MMTLSSDVYLTAHAGHARGMTGKRFLRAVALGGLLALSVLWTAAAAAPPRAVAPTADQVRHAVAHAAVRIEIEDVGTWSVCTGWIGWTEETRSAAYTAAHCFRPGARYRLTLAGGEEAVYATALSRWEHLDVMVLWFPRGGLAALRFWKPIPPGAFRAIYVLSDRLAPPRVVDVAVPRVHWEIRFRTHPGAVAIPLLSTPGTSGAPVVDLTDGALVGMIVGFAVDRPDLAAVVPAQVIYDALTAGSRR